ncbi:MAG: TolC family protein [Planctomycetaceae bacterium]|nr:TolC family protein [Planctomycetaceae bacterium]
MLICLALLCGCRKLRSHVWIDGDRETANYYVAQATHIAYPAVNEPVAVAAYALDPHRLRNLDSSAIRDISLAEAIHTSLTNSQIVRSSGQFLSSSNPLLNSPDLLPSRYDPAIQESGVLFGQRGVEAALSEFDAQFTSSMLWGHNETISNNAFTSGGLTPGDTLLEDTGVFNSEISKRFGGGGQFAVSHNWNYSLNNSPGRLFGSVYEGSTRAEFRQPLLAGAGTEYTRIAGPVSESIQGVTGVGQGVLVARINNDMALADFEQAVHTLLRDIETQYWQLYLGYQAYHSQVAARDAALDVWRQLESRARVGGAGAGLAAEADARDTYYRLRGQADAALDSLYAAEAELRRLMGLTVNDGEILRPTDEPVTANVLPDWNQNLLTAFARRPELRRQKWSIKSLDLQLRAAENLTRPRLDFVSAYQVNGFGDDLLGSPADGVTTKHLGNAYDTLASNQQTGWNLGLQFSVPIGLRYAHAQVRQFELRLAKAQAALQEQEVEISHEVAAAFRDLDRTYLALENSTQRLAAARDQHAALQSQHETDSERTPAQEVFRAQEAVAQAEITLASGLVEYNVALMNVQYRTGQLLEYDGITLTEGPWPSAAYSDADRHATARGKALPAILMRETTPPLGQ